MGQGSFCFGETEVSEVIQLRLTQLSDCLGSLGSCLGASLSCTPGGTGQVSLYSPVGQ